MIASDWVVGISVVVGEQGPLVRGAGLPVPPDRGGQGQQPLGDTDVDAGQGSSPVAFQPELVFEGVEGALDPLAPPTQRAQPVGSPARAGRRRAAPWAAPNCSNSRPANPLSPRMSSPGRSRGARGPAWRRPPRARPAWDWPGTRRPAGRPG